jgi:uncharacterized membrane protein
VTSGRRISRLVIVAAGLAGMAIATYLTITHYSGLPLVCTTTSVIDCEAVTSSSFSVVDGTGVPISLLGVGWFAISTGLALAGLRRPDWRAGGPLLVGWGMLGAAFVIYLVYAELVVIHRICEWCTAVHVLVATSFLASLARIDESAPD